MVKDIITTTQSNIKKNKISNLNDVYKSKYPIVTFSSNMAKFDKKIKNFLRKKMYYHRTVKSNTNNGKRIIKRLFSIGKMQKLLKDNQFIVKKVSGGPFIYNSKDNTTIILSMLNKTLQLLCDLKLPLIIRFADSGIILASKKNS